MAQQRIAQRIAGRIAERIAEGIAETGLGPSSEARARRLLANAGAALALVVTAATAHASECDRDQLSLAVIDDSVLAFSGSGGSRSVELQQGEVVLAKAARGCVGVVSTSRRLLTISSLLGGWRIVAYDLHEEPARELLLGDTVAIAVTDRRLLGYDPVQDHLSVEPLQLGETLSNHDSANNVAAVATNRRLLGLTTGMRSFAAKSLRLSEQIDDFGAVSDVATVTTNDRILLLRLGSGIWSERARRIN